MVSVDADPSFLRTVLSTISSPLPLDIIIVYQHYDVGYMIAWWEPFPMVEFDGGPSAADGLHRQRFKQLRKMYMVREFRPVFCADAIGCAMEHVMRGLEFIVEMERVRGRLDYLLRKPSIISEIRSPRTRLHDDNVGGARRWEVRASAL